MTKEFTPSIITPMAVKMELADGTQLGSLDEEAREAMARIALGTGVPYESVIEQALINENFLAGLEDEGHRLLLQKNGKLYAIERYPRTFA